MASAGYRPRVLPVTAVRGAAEDRGDGGGVRSVQDIRRQLELPPQPGRGRDRGGGCRAAAVAVVGQGPGEGPVRAGVVRAGRRLASGERRGVCGRPRGRRGADRRRSRQLRAGQCGRADGHPRLRWHRGFLAAGRGGRWRDHLGRCARAAWVAAGWPEHAARFVPGTVPGRRFCEAGWSWPGSAKRGAPAFSATRGGRATGGLSTPAMCYPALESGSQSWTGCCGWIWHGR